MIRVCHVITRLDLGGAQCNTLYTVANLDRSRFEPLLICGPGGELAGEADRIDARVHRISSLVREPSAWRDIRAFVALVRILRRERPRIVHTHSSKAGILGRWAARVAGVPIVIHSIHGYGFHRDQPRPVRAFYVALERLTGRLATTAFVAVSRANLEEGLRRELFTEDHVSLIRSGIRLGDFGPRRDDAVGETRKGVTVGMVSCLKPQKAPLDFVRVAARVLAEEDRPDVRFVLAGDGELRGELEALIRKERLGGAVDPIGWHRDIPGLMRRFDILLHTSRWEGLPRVLPEAMATGLPVVATSVDGAPEAVEDGVTGYLLKAGDIEGLARRVLELARDEGLRRRMGSEALRRVRPWDIDEMVRRQERLYARLHAGKTPALSRSARVEPG